MLRVSRVINALTGLSKNACMADINTEKRVLLANEIRKAEKFDFGVVPAELDPVDKQYVPPSLTPVEKEAFCMGLLPLPAPSCWYEAMIGPMIWAGMLIQARDVGGHIITPFVSGELPTREIIWGGEHAHVFSQDDDLRVNVRGIDSRFHHRMALSAQLEEKATVARADETYKAIDRPTDNWYLHNLEAACYMSVYLTLMINSKTTVVQRVIGPNAGSKHRPGGKSAMMSHRIVTIVPREFISREDGEGTHASPRLHWRRSHIRHYDHATPRSQFLAEHEHQGRKGWWLAVIPRFLVGKKELGEVTHDYFVKREAT